MTKILLDIMYEDLVMLFSNLKWIVKTVSQETWRYKTSQG